MVYLVLSVLFSSGLFVVFKLLDLYKIDTLQAIVINYVIAFLVGFYTSNVSIEITKISDQPWFYGALFLGFLFISIFFVMALTAQKNGLSVASVAGKMSVVIPIVFGIIVYNESVGFVKITGILLALIAVYLSSAKSDKTPVKFKDLLFPLLLFLGSGTIDTSLKFVEKNYVSKEAVPIFLATIFGTAFITGFVFLLIKLLSKTVTFQFKSIIGGVVLGIINYYSMAFLLKALQTKGMESSTLFTINNVAIVIFTTLFALVFFKEKLIKKNWMGIILAIISILLVVSA